MVLASQGWCSSPTHHPLSPNADQGSRGTYLRLFALAHLSRGMLAFSAVLLGRVV